MGSSGNGHLIRSGLTARHPDLDSRTPHSQVDPKKRRTCLCSRSRSQKSYRRRCTARDEHHRNTPCPAYKRQRLRRHLRRSLGRDLLRSPPRARSWRPFRSPRPPWRRWKRGHHHWRPSHRSRRRRRPRRDVVPCSRCPSCSLRRGSRMASWSMPECPGPSGCRNRRAGSPSPSELTIFFLVLPGGQVGEPDAASRPRLNLPAPPLQFRHRRVHLEHALRDPVAFLGGRSRRRYAEAPSTIRNRVSRSQDHRKRATCPAIMAGWALKVSKVEVRAASRSATVG